MRLEGKEGDAHLHKSVCKVFGEEQQTKNEQFCGKTLVHSLKSIIHNIRVQKHLTLYVYGTNENKLMVHTSTYRPCNCTLHMLLLPSHFKNTALAVRTLSALLLIGALGKRGKVAAALILPPALLVM